MTFTDTTVLISGVETVPIFDVVYMLKCARNNFVKKDIEINVSKSKKENEREFAAWDHIQIAYEMDHYALEPEKEYRLPKLTDAHIYDDKLKRMSVHHALEVFSDAVADELERRASTPGNTLNYKIHKYYIYFILLFHLFIY